MVSKTEENNIKVVPDEIINNNLAPNLHTPEQILTGKARVTPFRDKTHQKTHQGSLCCHPQLQDDRMSRTNFNFVYSRIV